jgi:hypothetical protein
MVEARKGYASFLSLPGIEIAWLKNEAPKQLLYLLMVHNICSIVNTGP